MDKQRLITELQSQGLRIVDPTLGAPGRRGKGPGALVTPSFGNDQVSRDMLKETSPFSWRRKGTVRALPAAAGITCPLAPP